MSHNLNLHHCHSQKGEENGHEEDETHFSEEARESFNSRLRSRYHGPRWRSVLRHAPRLAEYRDGHGMASGFNEFGDHLNGDSRVTGEPSSEDVLDGRFNTEATRIPISDTIANVSNEQLNGSLMFSDEAGSQDPAYTRVNVEASGVSNSVTNMSFDLENQLLQRNIGAHNTPSNAAAIVTDIDNGSTSGSIHNQLNAGSVSSETATGVNNLSDTATRPNYLAEVGTPVNSITETPSLHNLSSAITGFNNDMPGAATRLNNLSSMPLLMRLLTRDDNSSLGNHNTTQFSQHSGHSAEGQAQDSVPSNASQEVSGGLASISRLVRRSPLHWRRARRRFHPVGSLQSHDGHVPLRNVLNFTHSQDLRMRLNGILQSLDHAVSSATQNNGFSDGHALNRETSRANVFSSGQQLNVGFSDGHALNRETSRANVFSSGQQLNVETVRGHVSSDGQTLNMGNHAFTDPIGDINREMPNNATDPNSTSSECSANLNQEVCKDIPSGCKSSNFECNICLDMASDPVVTCCGHLYCWPCLYNWLHVHSIMKECPVCKGHLPDSAIIPIYGRGNNATESCDKIPPRPQGHPIRRELNNQDEGLLRGLFTGGSRVNFGSPRNENTNSNSNHNISSLVMERLRVAQRLHQEFFNRSIRIGQRMRRPIPSAPNLPEQRPRSNLETGLDNLAAHLDGLQANMQRVLELINSIPIQSVSSNVMEPLNVEASNVRSLDRLSQLRNVVGQLVESSTQSQRESPRAAEGGASGSTDVDLGPLHARKRRRLN